MQNRVVNGQHQVWKRIPFLKELQMVRKDKIFTLCSTCMSQTSTLRIVAMVMLLLTYPIIPPPPHFVVETLSSSKAKQSRKQLTSNLEGNPTSAESDSTDIEIQKAFVGKQRQLQ